MAILRVKDDMGNVIEIPAIKGDTPVKGVDYWTAEDVAAINAEVKTIVNEYINSTLNTEVI